MFSVGVRYGPNCFVPREPLYAFVTKRVRKNHQVIAERPKLHTETAYIGVILPTEDLNNLYDMPVVDLQTMLFMQIIYLRAYTNLLASFPI